MDFFKDLQSTSLLVLSAARKDKQELVHQHFNIAHLCQVQPHPVNTQNKHVRVQLLHMLTKWHYPHSPTISAAINQYGTSAGWATAANLQQEHVAAGWDRQMDGHWTDRQTDRRTPDRYIDPALQTMRAVSKSQLDVPFHIRNDA